MRVDYFYGKSFSDTANAAGISKSGCVVALGLFDGVHKAHRELIALAKRKAEELSLPLVVLTFSSDEGVIKPGVRKIYSDKDKADILLSLGADVVVSCDFASVRGLDGRVFAQDVLCRDLCARVVVCGFNFRFGKGAAFGASELENFLGEVGTRLLVVEDYHLGGKTLSSTIIRGLLADGKIEEANLALGEPYFIETGVSHGNGVGKTLGIPTVNSDMQKEKILLAKGVYLTETVIGSERYPSLTNVGTCPTFAEREVHAETYILGFDGDLYDETVRIKFLSFLREEKTFSNEKELVMQINNDKIKALELYGDLKWQDSGHN